MSKTTQADASRSKRNALEKQARKYKELIEAVLDGLNEDLLRGASYSEYSPKMEAFSKQYPSLLKRLDAATLAMMAPLPKDR